MSRNIKNGEKSFLMFIQSYSKTKTVLEAARERISFVFDNFESIIVSISGGKDSTVVAHLALLEASRRNRKIGIFFLDEEVVYQSTIDQVEYLLNLYPENTNRLWLQVPFNLTNATSYTDRYLTAWEPGKHKEWMRPKGRKNITASPWGSNPKIIKILDLIFTM
jgi:predicted phosphoadenosine phosphosulfate sulfurtransferase